LYGVGSIGLISGFIITAHMVGGGLLSYIGGVVFDKTGDYDVALIVSAVLAGVGMACTLLIRERRHGLSRPETSGYNRSRSAKCASLQAGRQALDAGESSPDNSSCEKQEPAVSKAF
jgi:sugar phosphate permease